MIALLSVVALAEPLPETGPFQRELASGLTVAAYGEAERLYVVTLDPARYALAYRSTLAGDGPRRDARAWATDDVHVVFNPGMFEPDGRATGYTRSPTFVSQPAIKTQSLYRSFFVVGSDGVAVLDRAPSTPGLLEELRRYDLVVQSLPILRDGHAVYPPRDRKWSELAFGTDQQGRIVVVFSRAPYTMEDLGKRLDALDIGLDALIHGEGGPEASLFVRAGGVELALMGSFETGFHDDSNQQLWSLPAVMVASPRP